jgi:hypothetical protein
MFRFWLIFCTSATSLYIGLYDTRFTPPLVETGLSFECCIHSSNGTEITVLQNNEQLEKVISGISIESPTVVAVDERASLHLDAGQFSVHWNNGTMRNYNLYRVRIGSFACSSAACYAIVDTSALAELRADGSHTIRTSSLTLLDVSAKHTGQLVVLGSEQEDVGLYSLDWKRIESSKRCVAQLYAGLLLSNGKLSGRNIELDLLLETCCTESALSSDSTVYETVTNGSSSMVPTTVQSREPTVSARSFIVNGGIYVIESIDYVPELVILTNTDSQLVLDPNSVTQFNSLDIRGGTLTVDLSDLDVGDGETLLLFTFSQLIGDFDEILLESTASACEQIRLERKTTDNNEYAVTVLRTTVCDSFALSLFN